MGRTVIPLRFDGAGVGAPLDRLQWIDARQARPCDEDLRRALTAAGLRCWQRSEPWPERRWPFPGMRALGAGDEDALFGRTEAVLDLVERVRVVRNTRRPA